MLIMNKEKLILEDGTELYRGDKVDLLVGKDHKLVGGKNKHFIMVEIESFDEDAVWFKDNDTLLCKKLENIERIIKICTDINEDKDIEGYIDKRNAQIDEK